MRDYCQHRNRGIKGKRKLIKGVYGALGQSQGRGYNSGEFPMEQFPAFEENAPAYWWEQHRRPQGN